LQIKKNSTFLVGWASRPPVRRGGQDVYLTRLGNLFVGNPLEVEGSRFKPEGSRFKPECSRLELGTPSLKLGTPALKLATPDLFLGGLVKNHGRY
jgi:hypothetical protein